MLASLLNRPGTISLEQRDMPKPMRGEVLVRVRAALTCGTDLKAYLRGHPAIPMPGPFGHEFAGTVVAVGSRVRAFRAGHDIMAVHSAPCLKCSYCKKKKYNLCENIMDTKILGAFSEHIVLPPHVVRHNAFRKPPSLTFEEAAMLEPLSCVVHGVEPQGIVRGETSLVIGAGPIGLMHLMLLKKKGASVAVSDLNASRLRAARALGADLAVKPEKIGSAIKKLTGGMGFDHVFECTGVPRVWESSVNHLRRGGTLILFGGCPPGSRVSYDTYRLHYDEITLRGVFHFRPGDVKAAFNLLKGRKLPVSKLISGRYPLRDIRKAFGELRRGRGIKYAIIP